MTRSAIPDEVVITDPTTGGQKGQKLARFDMIPPMVLWELACHYGKGEAKYPSDATGRANWTLGYRWSLSIGALERHLHQFRMREDVDRETGSSHLIAVMWHAAALRQFQLTRTGTDDRLILMPEDLAFYEARPSAAHAAPLAPAGGESS